jgi:hypothetical protein
MMEMECSSSVLTFEEVVLQAAVLHVLVDEQPVLVLAAVAHQLHQVGVPQLPQEDHLRLRSHNNKKNMPKSRQNPRATPTFFEVFPRSGPRAAVRTRSRAARYMGHPTYPSLPPEPGTVAIAQPPNATAASVLGISFRRTRPRLIARRDISAPDRDADRAVNTTGIYLGLFY